MDANEVIPVIRSPEQSYILKPEDDDSTIKLHEEAKEALHFWYTRKQPDEAMEEIRNKDAVQTAHRLESYKAISLNERSDDEVILVLKHRDEVMRAKAILILEDRILNSKNAQNLADLIDKLRALPRLLVGMLYTEDVGVLGKALSIFTEIIDDNLCTALRQVGGIAPICKLLNLESCKKHEELIQFLFFVILRLSKSEENRNSFRSVSGLIPMIEYLGSDNPRIKLMATQALLNLSSPDKSQPIIVRGGGLTYCFKNLSSENYDLKLETIFLIRNLACCDQGRENVSPHDLVQLVNLLNADEAYTTEEEWGSVEYKKAAQLQRITLYAILEFSANDRNKMILSQVQIIDRLRKFFMPMNPQNGLKWNFPILERVLSIFDRIISLENLRVEFLDARGLALVSRIVQNHEHYPEDCVLTAAQIITTIATTATSNQHSHATIGVQLLLGLLDRNPDETIIQQLVSKLLKSVAVNGTNRKIILDEGGAEVLVRLLKESGIKEILENSAVGLAALSTEAAVTDLILSQKLIPTLVGLLQLNLPELQVPVTDILSNVVHDDSGAAMVIKSGGMMPLVSLLHSKKADVLEGCVITFAKILFHKENGEHYRRYFYEAEGEVALLKILVECKEDRVLSPCLSVLSVLSQIRDGRTALSKAGITVKIEQLEREGKLSGDSQIANLLRVIRVNIKKEQEENRARIHEEAEFERKQNLALEAERRRIEELVKSVNEQRGSNKKEQKYWLKVEYEGLIKMFPVTLELTYPEFIYNLKYHFGIENYQNLTWRDSTDIMVLEDQSDLNYILDSLSNGSQPVVVVHALEPVKQQSGEKANKLDEYLKELTPRQLRELLKLAIADGAEIVPQLKQYMLVNRQAAKNKKPDVVPELIPLTTVVSGSSVPSTPVKSASTVSVSMAVAQIGSPLPVRSPPPPPPVVIKKSTESFVKKTHQKDGPMNFIEELQQGNTTLKKTDIGVEVGETGPKPPGRPDSLLEEIAETKLRHVDDADLERWNTKNPSKAHDVLMVEIKRQKEVEVSSGEIKLLNQGLEEGRKYWVRQPERYVEELHKAILLDYRMLEVILELTQNDEMTAFNEKFEKLKLHETLSQTDFAKALLSIGFNLRTRIFLKGNDENPTTEYTHIFQTSDLPIPVVLKTILATVKGLPDEYTYEVLVEDLSFLPMAVQTPLPEEEVVVDLVLPLPLPSKQNG